MIRSIDPKDGELGQGHICYTSPDRKEAKFIGEKKVPNGKLCRKCNSTGWIKEIVETGQQGIWQQIMCDWCKGDGYHKRKSQRPQI